MDFKLKLSSFVHVKGNRLTVGKFCYC